MNTSTNRNQLVILIVSAAIIVLIILWSIYYIISAITASSSTGTLKVDSTDNNASISITQLNHQAQLIGVGSSNIVIKPGSYLVAVSDKGELATKVVKVQQKQITNLTLNPSDATLFPSVLNVKFNNMGDLINSGITTTQATKIEMDFFQFMPTEKSVTVVPSSITPAPRNPSIASGFTTNFTVEIDGITYKAAISYSDITNIRLQLYSLNNSLVFDSYNLST